MPDFIHNDPEFHNLLEIVSNEQKINISLVEKDYWIMHSLYGLQQQGMEFELKGGTSLSKGFGITKRFSEDIDIHIKTNFGLTIEGKDDNTKVREGRKKFYDVLAGKISINGIIKVERDHNFDDFDKYRSGGIRLYYNSTTVGINGIKEGILLEAGFDNVVPNQAKNISSWVIEYLINQKMDKNYIDNRAIEIACYHPGYTLVEKLQTIVNKHRKFIENKEKPSNFIRQYYDVFCLLKQDEVVRFIGSDEYSLHKTRRFKGADQTIPLAVHPALTLDNKDTRFAFETMYRNSASLYYHEQPQFDEILLKIKEFMHLL